MNELLILHLQCFSLLLNSFAKSVYECYRVNFYVGKPAVKVVCRSERYRTTCRCKEQGSSGCRQQTAAVGERVVFYRCNNLMRANRFAVVLIALEELRVAVCAYKTNYTLKSVAFY